MYFLLNHVFCLHYQGNHPVFYGETLDLPVCVSLSGDCCERTWYIRVANCGEFFTYLLTDTPGCFMAYCAGNVGGYLYVTRV